MKTRYNISIDSALHAWATEHAHTSGRDFSEYLEDLIRSDRGDVYLTGTELAALPDKISKDVLQQLSKQKHVEKRERKPKGRK